VAAVAAEAWARFDTLGRFLQWGGRPDDLPAPAGNNAVLEELRQTNDGNVIVFPTVDPFVGCGTPVGEDSFTVPLIPAEEERLPRPLRSGEVVDELARSLRMLAEPHMRVDTRLYVNGYNVALLPDLLPDPRRRPRTHAPQPLLRQMIDRPTGIVRPYLCVEFTSWHGQLVVTTCIRVVILPGVLYVESAAYVLPPLKAEYYDVDRIRAGTVAERLIAVAADTARAWLPALLAAPARLVAALRDAADGDRVNREHRRRVADRVFVDYGTATSIREEASGDTLDSHFMAQDADMYVQIVQQRVADALTEFLEARGFRTDKVKQIQNKVTNIVGGHNVLGDGNSIGAFGEGATNISYGGGPAEVDLATLDRRIAELRDLIDRYAARMADPSTARDAVDAAAEEVRNGGGRTRGLRVALNAVAGAAPGITAVTQAVRELLQLASPTP